jgi:hypothetical protein
LTYELGWDGQVTAVHHGREARSDSADWVLPSPSTLHRLDAADPREGAWAENLARLSNAWRADGGKAAVEAGCAVAPAGAREDAIEAKWSAYDEMAARLSGAWKAAR